MCIYLTSAVAVSTIKDGDIIGVLSFCGDLNKLHDRLS